MDEVFAQGISPIHRLDPRVKVIIAAAFSVVVALGEDFAVLLVAIPFPLVLIALARLAPKAVLRRLVVVNVFVLFLWLFIPLSFRGGERLSLGALSLSKEGVIWCLKITLKSNVIVLGSIALFSTTPIFSLVHALRHLWVPDKLVHLLFFCFRYVHVIEREYERLLKAMKVRGFEPRSDLHTYRSYAYLVGTLLLKGSDRSQRVYQAMICRGFEGKYWVLDHFSLKRGDVVAFSLMAVWVLWLGFLQWGGIF